MLLEFNLNFFLIFTLTSLLITFFISKYSKNLFSGSLLDKDFLKPQAFHKIPTARAGGIAFLLVLNLFILFYFLKFNVFLEDYFVISFALFFLGFLDDLKIKINPDARLILMILILLVSIEIFSIQITKTGLEYLDFFLENKIFQLFFFLLCFLFIINGANLIDGYNGLLAIHFIAINFILSGINLINQHYDFLFILISQIIIMFSFLFFNFPKAKIFLGDSGSYLCGSLICLNTIKTHQLNPEVSPFFYASILFYLFYEVFFSFIRKSIKKKSPLEPDKSHLHMLLYQSIEKLKKFKDSNYIVSSVINLTYFILIFPLLYFQEDWLFCRYYFFFLLFFYTTTYYFLLRSKKA